MQIIQMIVESGLLMEIWSVNVDVELVRGVFLGFLDGRSFLEGSFEGPDLLAFLGNRDAKKCFLDAPSLKPWVHEQVCKAHLLSQNIRPNNILSIFSSTEMILNLIFVCSSQLLVWRSRTEQKADTNLGMMFWMNSLILSLLKLSNGVREIPVGNYYSRYQQMRSLSAMVLSPWTRIGTLPSDSGSLPSARLQISENYDDLSFNLILNFSKGSSFSSRASQVLCAKGQIGSQTRVRVVFSMKVLQWIKIIKQIKIKF